MKREIKYIVVHCTATPTTTTIESIKAHWKNVLGWQNPGYHYIIQRNGTIVPIHPESQVANGVAGYNPNCIHLSYIGGVDANSKPIDNRTPAQKEAMFNLIMKLHNRYPNAEIKGHRDFPKVQKDCPSFDVKTWLKQYEHPFLQAA